MKADVVTLVKVYMKDGLYSHQDRVHEVKLEDGDVIFSRKDLRLLKVMYDVESHETKQRKINIS
jgi:hypothetical protein